MKRSQSKGFTLIELLVVIAIIGLLSTLAVVALNSARQRSRDAKRVSDIRQIQTALELSFSETNAYPTEPAADAVLGVGTVNTKLCVTTVGPPAVATFADTATACTGSTYMGLVPANPSPNGASYRYTSLTSAGADCLAGTTCAAYRLKFNLEGATGQLGAGDNCANQNGIITAATC